MAGGRPGCDMNDEELRDLFNQHVSCISTGTFTGACVTTVHAKYPVFFQELVARTRALNKKVIAAALPEKLSKADKTMICSQISTAFSDLLAKQRNWKRASVPLKSPYDMTFRGQFRKDAPAASSSELPVADEESVANSDLNDGMLQLDLDSPVREVVAQAPGLALLGPARDAIPVESSQELSLIHI